MLCNRTLFSGLVCLLIATPLAAQQDQATDNNAGQNAAAAEPVAADAAATAATAPQDAAAQPAATDTVAPEAPVTEPVTEWAQDIRQSNYLPFPAPQMVAMLPGVEGWQPNTVSAPFPREFRSAMAQAGMAASPWSMRQMINFMSHKLKVQEGISFDEVIQAMDSRAIEVNFKKVGFTHISKELNAKLGEQTPHIAILHYCDALVGRKIMDYSPEFSIFLPCRISLIEDGKGDMYLMTMDWDVTWLNYAWHPDSQLDAELKQDAVRIRDAMHSIMTAGATGDW